MANRAMSSDITTVVMLMLENRSLDNLFGYLYGPGDKAPRFHPEGSVKRFNGVPFGASNPAIDDSGVARNYEVKPIPIKQILAQGGDPSIIPWWNPTEEITSFLGTGHGVINQMFGNTKKVSTLPPAGVPAQMLGFLQDYWETKMQEKPHGAMDILWMFQREQIPYLYTAAMIGAISDAWHSSVPTDTNPNRAFSLCGTSLGKDRNESPTAVETFDVPTIFNAVAAGKKSCGLYYAKPWRKDGTSYTAYTFPQAPPDIHEIATMDKFFARAAAGELPDFTYLEPMWGGGVNPEILFCQGTDLHPPTSVTVGDHMLGLIVSRLTKSPQWPNMLIIITFDEHGGTYDHVSPPWTATPPDDLKSADGFGFNLFGVRVPTILISPFIQPFTVFRAPQDGPPFDHTSFLKSLTLWCGQDPGMFRARAKAAPAFWDLLSASDEQAADHADAARKAFATAPAELAEIANPGCDQIFEGMGFASVRSILLSSPTREEIDRKVADYRRDPEGFEARLAAGKMPL